MPDIPRRRWFRFGLRTMFVVMTLVACGLGWELRLVRERQAVIREIRQIDVDYRATRIDPKRPSPEVIVTAASQLRNDFRSKQSRSELESQVSWFRRQLGDEAYFNLVVSPSDDPRLPKLIERMENAFPEAELFHGFSYRDSLNKPLAERRPNQGSEFNTGLKNVRDLEMSD